MGTIGNEIRMALTPICNLVRSYFRFDGERGILSTLMARQPARFSRLPGRERIETIET
jgi:hypothetical protein